MYCLECRRVNICGMLMRQGRTVTGMMQHAGKHGQTAIAMVCKNFYQLGKAANIDLNGCTCPMLLHCPTFYLAAVKCGDPGCCPVIGQTQLFKARLSKSDCLSYECCFHLESSTPAWNVYCELGIYPLKVFVVWQLIRFINKLWHMPESTWAWKAMWDAW
jgi:hypothetical protein